MTRSSRIRLFHAVPHNATLAVRQVNQEHRHAGDLADTAVARPAMRKSLSAHRRTRGCSLRFRPAAKARTVVDAAEQAETRDLERRATRARRWTHPPEPEPGQSGPFDVTPPCDHMDMNTRATSKLTGFQKRNLDLVQSGTVNRREIIDELVTYACADLLGHRVTAERSYRRVQELLDAEDLSLGC